MRNYLWSIYRLPHTNNNISHPSEPYRTAYAKGIGHGDVKDDMVTMREFQVVLETIWRQVSYVMGSVGNGWRVLYRV